MAQGVDYHYTESVPVMPAGYWLTKFAKLCEDTQVDFSVTGCPCPTTQDVRR